MVLAILQARMSSTRLPGKVVRPLVGQPMLARQIERLRRAAGVTRLVVATSDGPEDDVLEGLCQSLDVNCFRGDLSDVLSRFMGAIAAFGPVDTFARLTADCPLTDPQLIDQAIVAHQETGADYTHVQQQWTYPKGLDVEICQTAILSAVHKEATGRDREHVTSYIYARPERFRITALNRDPPLRYRWTVDTQEDFDFVQAVYEALYPANPAFTTEDILAWQAAHPDRVLKNDPPVEARA